MSAASSWAARTWRPSTFWVMIVTSGWLRARRARARCPEFGEQVAIKPRRQPYHSQTVNGSRAKASGVASSSGWYDFQRPLDPRKVGTPDSAEIPAPVTATILRAALRSVCACSSSSFTLLGLTYPRMTAEASNSQPAMKARPPKGVTAPSQRCPVRTRM
mgnify:CR=1 FL=1